MSPYQDLPEQDLGPQHSLQQARQQQAAPQPAQPSPQPLGNAILHNQAQGSPVKGPAQGGVQSVWNPGARGPNGPVPSPPPPAPQAPQVGQFRHQLRGFNLGNLNSASTPKDIFGKYAQNYDTRQVVANEATRNALLNDLRNDPSGFFKDASFGGRNFDKLIWGGGQNEFDVITNAALGGQDWWFHDINKPAPVAQPRGEGSSALLNAIQGSGRIQQPMNLQQLQASTPESSQNFLQQILSQLFVGGRGI